MLKTFTLFTCLLSLLMGQALPGIEDPKCSIGQAPEWIHHLSFKPLDPSNKGDDENILYLLLDFQIDLDHETSFTHVVKALPTSAAVQQSSLIEVEFDPSYESIMLHHLCIHRNQECIDKLSSVQQEIIQPEKNIDDYQYSGRKTWLMLLDDVQIGDVIEYSYSRIGQNPAFNGIYDEEFYLQTSVPIQHGTYRIIGSQKRKLHFKSHGSPLQPVHRLLPNGIQEWSWEIEAVEPYQIDSSRPSWHLGIPMLQASEFANWSEIAEWGSGIFALPKTHSSEMQQLIGQWQEQSSSTEKHIVQALRFVQKEIRYLGIEMGSGTHKPEDPNVVLQRRYGDCKDKTLLLKTLLALMGIDSQPVLVSSWLKGHISDWHPAFALFDHVVLQVPHDGQLLWVDPTLTNQECVSLRENCCGLYGKGLVLDPTSNDLAEMPALPPSKILAKTTIEVGSPGDPSMFETKICYLGSEADRLRGIYRNWGHKEVEKYFDDYFAEHYGLLEKTAPLVVKDDQAKNAFSFKFGYVFHDIWKEDHQDQHYYFTVFPKHIFESIDFTINPLRQSPLSLDHPTHVLEHITIVNKDDEWIAEPFHKEFENDDIAFNYQKKQEAKNLQLKYEWKTKNDHVPVGRLVEHRKLLQGIEDLIFLTITVPKSADDYGWLFENDNYPLLGALTILYAWMIVMLVKKKKITGDKP